MFSKTCEYAIRSVVYISAEGSLENKISIDELCKHIEAPKHFTAKILQSLTRKRIVSSQKGVNGGFYMNTKQSAKRLIDIVDTIDGDNLFTGCGIGMKECSEEEPCPMHDKFKAIKNQIRKTLSDSTIESLAKKYVKGKGALKNN